MTEEQNALSEAALERALAEMSKARGSLLLPITGKGQMQIVPKWVRDMIGSPAQRAR